MGTILVGETPRAFKKARGGRPKGKTADVSDIVGPILRQQYTPARD